MVIQSPYPSLNIPNIDIPTFLFETPRPKEYQFPRTRKIFIDAATRQGLSLNEVHDQARRFGQGLIDFWRWEKGDVLCIFSVNQLDTAVVIFGTQYALGVGMAQNI